MTQTPAGWYDDGRGALRYWDGSAWTEHVHQTPAPAVPVASAPSTPQQRGGNVPAWVWWASGAVLALLLVAVVTLTIFTAMKPNPERDARAAWDAYDAAWSSADCDALWEVTTEAFREEQGYLTCADVAKQIVGSDKPYDDYYRWVDTTHVDGTTATVTTWEDGYTDEGYDEFKGTYTLTLVDGQWYVTSAELEKQPGYDDEY